jgi:hypothetical protein
MIKFLFDGKEFETRREAEEYIHDDYACELYDDYFVVFGCCPECGSPNIIQVGKCCYCNDFIDIEELNSNAGMCRKCDENLEYNLNKMQEDYLKTAV